MKLLTCETNAHAATFNGVSKTKTSALLSAEPYVQEITDRGGSRNAVREVAMQRPRPLHANATRFR